MALAGFAASLGGNLARAAAQPVFTNPPENPAARPSIRRIALPGFPGAHAIWGATGRDAAGGIWCGVSADGGDRSAHLLHFDPATGSMADRGDVLGALARLGNRPAGESQVKIHSRILTLSDGNLYFTSTDEEGEQEDGSAPPRWGSHLWRLRPPDGAWEHLLAVPEGLTCAAAGGSTVWALGLWGHVLHRYDTRTGAHASVAVGAPGGHMSRNVLADARGHAYVPSVRQDADGSVQAELLEFAPDMTLRGATPLASYAAGQTPQTAHGIVGFTMLAEGRIAFTTGAGFVHLVTPRADGPAQVKSLGWFHPAGHSYPACLFTWDGKDMLAGLAQTPDSRWHWVAYSLRAAQGHATPLDLPLEQVQLLYGSDTRDDRGRFYVAGRHTTAAGKLPVLLQLDTAG